MDQQNGIGLLMVTAGVGYKCGPSTFVSGIEGFANALGGFGISDVQSNVKDYAAARVRHVA